MVLPVMTPTGQVIVVQVCQPPVGATTQVPMMGPLALVVWISMLPPPPR